MTKVTGREREKDDSKLVGINIFLYFLIFIIYLFLIQSIFEFQ